MHSNGYALALKAAGWPQKKAALKKPSRSLKRPLGDVLLTPTRIYVRPILDLLRHTDVHAIAHITGGGLVRNLARILPRKLRATVHTKRWTPPAIFPWIQQAGHVAQAEMFRTFNMGIGLVLALPPQDQSTALRRLGKMGMEAIPIGRISTANSGRRVRFE